MILTKEDHGANAGRVDHGIAHEEPSILER